MYTWLGVLGPPRLPSAIRDRIASVTVSVLRQADIERRAAADGYEIVSSNPVQFAKDMREEIATLERVIKANNLRAPQ